MYKSSGVSIKTTRCKAKASQLGVGCSTITVVQCWSPLSLMKLGDMQPLVRSFLARNSRSIHVYAIARYMLSPVRPSVTRVDQSKMVEVRIMQLSPQSSPMTLVSSWLTSPCTNIGSGGAKWDRGIGKIRNFQTYWLKIAYFPYPYSQFSANKSPYLRNGGRLWPRLLWRTNRKSHMRFQWPWMTLNCHKFKFSRKFALVRIFGKQKRLNEWR